MTTTTLPIPALTLRDLCQERDAAIGLYADAEGLFKAALEKFKQASDAAKRATQGSGTGLRIDKRNAEMILSPDFVQDCQNALDREMWEHFIRATKLGDVMDREARDELRASLQDKLVPATYDNARATLESLILDAEAMLNRGVVNLFCRLDRDYKTNKAFKIGNKIKFTYMFDEWDRAFPHFRQHLNYRKYEEIIDLERVLFVIDGKAPPDHGANVVAKIRALSNEESEGRYLETDYLSVKWFKNGNCDVVIKDADMVHSINRRIAQHFGETLADDSRQPNPHRPGNRPMPKQNGHEAFYTPADLADRVAEEADIGPEDSVLDPSFGKGAMFLAAHRRGAWNFTGYEIDGEVAAATLAAFDAKNDGSNLVYRIGDFMDLPTCDVFDKVIMNPPFRVQIEHVQKAFGLLRSGGRLVAIMSNAITFRTDERHRSFTRWLTAWGAVVTPLPENSFKESGTAVATVMVVINRP